MALWKRFMWAVGAVLLLFICMMVTRGQTPTSPTLTPKPTIVARAPCEGESTRTATATPTSTLTPTPTPLPTSAAPTEPPLLIWPPNCIVLQTSEPL